MEVQAEESGVGEQIILEEEIDETYEPSDEGMARHLCCVCHGQRKQSKRLGLFPQKYENMQSGWAWTSTQRRY